MKKNKKQSKETAQMQERIKNEGFSKVFESLGRKEKRTSGFVQPAYLNQTNTEKPVITSFSTTEELSVVDANYLKIYEKLNSCKNDEKIKYWNMFIGTKHPDRYIHKNTQEELLKCIPSIEEFFNCITVSSQNPTEYAKYLYRNTGKYFIIDVDKYKHINYLRTFDYINELLLHEAEFLAVFNIEYLTQEIMNCPDSLDNFTR